MMGPLEGSSVDVRRFGVMKPTKVLYDFDGPRTFTFKDATGSLHLAHWFDEDACHVRFLVVPFTDVLLRQLEAGALSVRDALNQPQLWIVDLDNSQRPIAATLTTLAQLRQDELPVPGALLLPHLEQTLEVDKLDAFGACELPGVQALVPQ